MAEKKLEAGIDPEVLGKVMARLEEMEDEALAVKYLSELNLLTKELGKLVMNTDSNLAHQDWLKACEAAKQKVDHLVEKILYGA